MLKVLALCLVASMVLAAPFTGIPVLKTGIDREAWASGAVLLIGHVFGQDTLTFDPINMYDAFGGVGAFDGVIYFTRYRYDNPDTLGRGGSSSDSVQAKIVYQYGSGIHIPSTGGDDYLMSPDYMKMVDTNALGKIDYPRSSHLCKYVDIDSIAYTTGEYKTVPFGYDQIKKVAGDTTQHVIFNYRTHNEFQVKVVGGLRNGHCLDTATPIDSTTGCIIKIMIVKMVGDMQANYAPSPELMAPQAKH
jgi:hypothetical protein